MPTESVDIKINGQHASSIHFLKQGIIFFIADMKDQTLICSLDLLNAPISHSERGIALNQIVSGDFVQELDAAVQLVKSN